jgi:hypothetical protein
MSCVGQLAGKIHHLVAAVQYGMRAAPQIDGIMI